MTHVVKSGESLTSIANQYGTTVYSISRENNISPQAVLQIGQILRITQPEKAVPTSTPQPTAPPPAADPAQSTSATPQGNDNPTPANQPAVTATPPPTATSAPSQQGCAGYAHSGETRYTVHGGDTLSGLAARYSTTVWTIKTRNCLRSDTLQVGQLLIVPVGGSTPPPATPTSTTQGTDPTPTRAPATATPTRRPTSTPPSPSPTPTPNPTPRGSWLDRLLGRNG